MSFSIDRRNFLFGAGGAVLALPMLESLLPRTARGGATPPKRLLIVLHSNGRVGGDGGSFDAWSPGARSGPLPEIPSPLLAALAPIRDRILTVDGVDNRVRLASGVLGGHSSAHGTILSCSLEGTGLCPDTECEVRPTGPSLDYVAGTRLRSSEAQDASIVIPMSTRPDWDNLKDDRVFMPGGTPPRHVSGYPRLAVEQLFGPAMMEEEPEMPRPPTLRERLTSGRRSILDGVRRELSSVRGRVSARDRLRIDAHTDRIRELELQEMGFVPNASTSCRRPDETLMPLPGDDGYEWRRGRSDAITAPHQIENIAMALACDVTRCVVAPFEFDPVFSDEFPEGSPFEIDNGFHSFVHLAWEASDAESPPLLTGFQHFGRLFTSMVQRLGEIEDIDGSSVLDNTLVLWTSELGYGASHACWNIPIVLAGLGGAFGKGQHIVQSERRSTGDFYAQVLRLLGEEDRTFGDTSSTLGELADSRGAEIDATYGFPDAIDRNTPLHTGDFELPPA
jgi:hypothetical protein